MASKENFLTIVAYLRENNLMPANDGYVLLDKHKDKVAFDLIKPVLDLCDTITYMSHKRIYAGDVVYKNVIYADNWKIGMGEKTLSRIFNAYGNKVTTAKIPLSIGTALDAMGRIASMSRH